MCVFLSFVFVFLHVMCSMGLVPEIKLMYVCMYSKVILTIFYNINASSFKMFHTETVKSEWSVFLESHTVCQLVCYC